VDNFRGSSAQLANLCDMRVADQTGGPTYRTFQAIEVDHEALCRSAAQLRALAREMSSRDGSLQAGLEQSPIYHALRHAERDWKHQRDRLRAFFDDAAGALEQTASAYHGTDAALGRAAGQAPR
jgi:hypothetical protein